MNVQELPTAEGYDLWAKHYESNGNPMTGLDEIIFKKDFPLHLIKQKTIVDIGCGTGRISRILSAGAAKVTGLDISAKMLEIARQNDPKSRYIQIGAESALPFADESVDFIVSNLVLEHIGNLAHFFKEIARISKKTSVIYISAMHPAMLLKGTQANFKDPQSGNEYRPKGYPHQIADFVENMNKSGLRIEKMREFSGTEELVKRFPKAAKYLGWPMLLTFIMKPMA